MPERGPALVHDLNRLFDKGLVDTGFLLEFISAHTNVVSQRGYDQRGYGGINPYALGFAMFYRPVPCRTAG